MRHAEFGSVEFSRSDKLPAEATPCNKIVMSRNESEDLQHSAGAIASQRRPSHFLFPNRLRDGCGEDFLARTVQVELGLLRDSARSQTSLAKAASLPNHRLTLEMNSVSQFGEDVLLWEHFQKKPDGFFV